jgi:hypothetical protein
VRFTSYLVTIWNRDADHAEGVAGILETVLREVPGEVKPKEGSYYYKKHADHAGFKGTKAEGTVQSGGETARTPTTGGSLSSGGSSTGAGWRDG